MAPTNPLRYRRCEEPIVTKRKGKAELPRLPLKGDYVGSSPAPETRTPFKSCLQAATAHALETLPINMDAEGASVTTSVMDDAASRVASAPGRRSEAAYSHA